MPGIYGLSGSGLDIDTVVKNLMKAQSKRYETLQQRKTLLEWRKTAYNTFYKSVNDFRNTTVWNSTLKNNTSVKNAVSNNEAVAKVTANADAANGSHTMTVTQLATGVNIGSNSKISAGANKDTLASQFGVSGDIEFKINGKSIVVNSKQSIYSVVSIINGSGAGVQASYDANLDRFFLKTAGTGSGASIDFTGSSDKGMSFLSNSLKLDTIQKIGTSGITGLDTFYGNKGIDELSSMGFTGSVTLNIRNGDQLITRTFNDYERMSDIVDWINGAAGINAEASFNTTSRTFSLKATEGELDISGNDAVGMDFLYKYLKLPAATKGTDAKFNLNGVNLTQSSNKFTISGINYDLQGLGTVGINVTTDKAKIVENVKSFVEAYNAQLDMMYTAANQKRDKSFMPLTADERSALSESEIKLYEDKAKIGLLYHDRLLLDAAARMRSDIMAPVAGLTGKYTSAFSIGISSRDYLDNGKLYLDEDKLLAALEQDPEIVSKIFGSGDSTSVHAQKGIANRLYSTMKSVSDKIVSEAGVVPTAETISSIGKQINAYQKNMDDWVKRLNAMESAYYKKFNAMEVALNNMVKQSSWLSTQFAVLTGQNG